MLRSTLFLGTWAALGCAGTSRAPCTVGFKLSDADHCVADEGGGGDSGAGSDSGVGSDDTASPPSHPRVEFGPVMPCDAPVASVSYTDVALDWGIAEPAFVLDEHTEAAATAVADFDLDGDLDILFFFREEPALLHSRDGNGFVQIPLAVGEAVTQLGMADLDGDGRLDLLLGGFSPEVLLNTASGWVSAPFPVSSFVDERSVTKSIHPMDIDKDGISDAYVLMSAVETTGTSGMDVIAWGVGDGSFVLDETVIPPK